jgi:hypothetical protein
MLNLYRMATILGYQEDGGPVKRFELTDIGFKTYPVDPKIFSINK